MAALVVLKFALENVVFKDRCTGSDGSQQVSEDRVCHVNQYSVQVMIYSVSHINFIRKMSYRLGHPLTFCQIILPSLEICPLHALVI